MSVFLLLRIKSKSMRRRAIGVKTIELHTGLLCAGFCRSLAINEFAQIKAHDLLCPSVRDGGQCRSWSEL